jgi:23S rRNA (adenine2503-C2)-methyltransferase
VVKIRRNIKVPTGNIMVIDGASWEGQLECLSLGDYGKEVNIKCDSMGLSRSIDRVEHQALLPLTEKWVITISTQYGCAMNCNFCDAPKVKYKYTPRGTNAEYIDLLNQVVAGIQQHPEVTSTKRLNIHFARMGEPTWNQNVIDFARNLRTEMQPYLGRSLIHPVVSTMLPKYNPHLGRFLADWMEIKNHHFRGDAGLQLSINSTDNAERDKMFNGNALSIEDAAELAANLDPPKGRKITLNFAVADYTVDAVKLRQLFDPRKFLVKLTPMHKTATALSNNVRTSGDYTSYYPYQELEESLKKVGFDVLVFIASEYEDLGRITCGNAILAGTMPECPFEEIGG